MPETRYVYASFWLDDGTLGVCLRPATDAEVAELPPWYVVTVNEATDKKGGPGSGNFGHAGRPGLVGGSAAGSSQPAALGSKRVVDFDESPWDFARYKDAPDTRPYIRSVADAKAVRAMLREQGRLNPDGRTVSLYHVTDSDSVTSILRQGLIPGYQKAPGQDWQAEYSAYATYFFEDRGVAADQAAESGAGWSVIEARIPITPKSLLRILPDEDSGEDIMMGVDVLLDGGTVAYIGGVPAAALYDVTAAGAKGGPGSGNFGHAGRPGLVGGSARGTSAPAGAMARADLIAEAERRLEAARRDDELISSAMIYSLAAPRRRSEAAFAEIEQVVAASDFDSAQRALDSQAAWQSGHRNAIAEWQAAQAAGANGVVSAATQQALQAGAQPLADADTRAFAARRAWMVTEFRRKYGDSVTVYRGVSGKYVKDLPTAGPIDLPVYGLSSWTTSRYEAFKFVSGKYGKLLKTTISAADVWLLARHGVTGVSNYDDALDEIVIINRGQTRPVEVA